MSGLILRRRRLIIPEAVDDPQAPPTPPGSSNPMGAGTAQSGGAPTIPTTNWVLEFEDQFTGTSFSNRWSQLWLGPNMNDADILAANSWVDNGTAWVQVSATTGGSRGYGFGGLVHTAKSAGHAGANGYDFVYGYAEARCRFPGDTATSGGRNWPAWWTAGYNWPVTGEYDIAETLGGTLSTAYHHGLNGVDHPHNVGHSGSWFNNFHVFGIWRRPGRTWFYWNGNYVWDIVTDEGPTRHYPILNCGAGRYGGTGLAGTTGALQCDYVRIWTGNP